MHLPRHAELWGAPYLKSRLRSRLAPTPSLNRIWLLLADHYEPLWENPSPAEALSRVRLWADNWPRIAAQCPRDSAGRSPVYTMFYPQEEYRPELLAPLAEMARSGITDVEVHIHHDGEGRQDFITRISEFCKALHGNHGLLRSEDGKLRFAFIHGNWALDNSRPDGRYCGLNDEITLLRDLGCYADFTMPSGNHPTQSRLINTIYWCTDNPSAPRSFDTGTLARPGGGRHGDLLMVPGPLGLRWAERLLPRLETGEIAGNDPPKPYRVKRWLDLAPRLGGDCFIKLFSHGTQPRNSDVLLGSGLLDLFTALRAEADARGAQCYFVNAWDMAQAIDAIVSSQDPVARIYGATSTAHASPAAAAALPVGAR